MAFKNLVFGTIKNLAKHKARAKRKKLIPRDADAPSGTQPMRAKGALFNPGKPFRKTKDQKTGAQKSRRRRKQGKETFNKIRFD